MFTFASQESRFFLTCVFLSLWPFLPLEAKNVRDMYNFTGINPVHCGHNMVIFVLDRVIWPFQVDKLNKSLSKLSEIKPDDLGDLHIYPEVHDCLDSLQKMGYVLAAVCNCKVMYLADNLLDAFDLSKYFAYQVCSEKDKLSPVQTLHEQSGVDYEDMLYFDYDLRENLPLFALNITFCPIDDRGISKEAVEKALEIFAVRTTLKPPLKTTKKPKNPDDSSEYSLKIDYKEFDFRKPSTDEILRESSSTEEDEQY